MGEEKIELDIVCPCGGRVIVTSDPKSEEFTSLSHVLPMCVEFRDMEPEDYLRWVRGKMEGHLDA